MVTLPRLESYSQEQIEKARALSYAFNRYYQLLPNLATNSYHSVRHRAWMECTLATYFSTATTRQICLAWSQCADQLLTQAWKQSGLTDSEATLFALGKHGAEELNLSSDIDLLLVGDLSQSLDIEKKLRKFQSFLQSTGEFGFCFRLDFDLRPGGKLGPMVTSPMQFQDYYWSQGETWERLAMVRLRAITGKQALAQQIHELAKKFSYRKFLDFTLLQDLKALRSKVHQKGFVRKPNELHIKLEVGGIRDIELLVHSLLILNGGKIPKLQTRSTSIAFDNLKSHSLLPAVEADFLHDQYWRFRHYENIAQSIDDRQTHFLSDQLTSRFGVPPLVELQKDLDRVDRSVSSLLGHVDMNQVNLPPDLKSQHEWLTGLGFSKNSIDKTWTSLIGATALSHRNDRDERARQEFLYTFVTELARNKDLDRELGMELFVDFVRATRAKATFFSMLLSSPRLIQDLARLFCLSPYLSSILTSRPELLDHFILQVDDAWSEDLEQLLVQMNERRLLSEIWAANQFLSDFQLPELYERITSTADEITSRLLWQLKQEFSEATLQILTLGKWGGRELGLRSDLDFIFITPKAPNESDFKVARRFISRLSDPTRGGHLYDVDLRLRPSGQSGPLLVSRDQLENYWRTQAAAWERQAYLRARPMDFQCAKDALVSHPLGAGELEELKRIREKLLKIPTSYEEIDLKHTPGGLIDIEFSAQVAILFLQINTAATSTDSMIEELIPIESLWKRFGPKLLEIYRRLRTLEQTITISNALKTHILLINKPEFRKAASLLNLTVDRARTQLIGDLTESREILNQLDPTGLVRTPSLN